jgi:hypothetical protein
MIPWTRLPKPTLGSPKTMWGNQRERAAGSLYVLLNFYPGVCTFVDISLRFMLLPRNGNSVTGRRRLLLESAERSISSSWRKLSGSMKPIFITFKPPTGALLMNVSC